MMWYLQLIADFMANGLPAEAAANLVFAALVLWACFGTTPRACALLTAALHVLLVLM